MLAQIDAAVVTTLSNALVVVGEPGAALVDDIMLHSDVQKRAFLGDAFAVDHVKLGDTERRGNLVLDDLDLGMCTDDIGAVLQKFAAADIETDRGVELQCTAAGRGLGIAVENADFFTQLVDEDGHAAGLGDDAGQLAQSLGHESCLKTDEAVAHQTFDFLLRNECCDGVDHDDIDSA